MKRILVPPGIGDAYWVMVKLRGFLKERGIDMPEVLVHQDGGPLRTQAFIESVPFVRAAGYHRIPTDMRRVVHEAYRTDGRTVFTEVPGVDYYISYNGVLGAGRSLVDVDPTFPCEWHLPLRISPRSYEFQRQLGTEPYVVAYFPDGGFFRAWWTDFGPARTQETLEVISKRLGVRIIHIGADWDVGSIGYSIAESNKGIGWENWIGKTSYHDMVGVLLGARAVVGYPSGATILPTVWNVPTAMFWNKYFKPAFWRNIIAPDAPYAMIDTHGLTVEMAARTVQTLVEKSDASRAQSPSPIQG